MTAPSPEPSPTPPPASVPPEVDAIIPPALRQDLEISRQLFEGHRFVILKDPVSLKYFRLGAEDHALAALFDGRRTVAEIRAAFLQAHPHASLAADAAALTQRITRFAEELLLSGFLEATAAGARAQLERRRRSRKPATPWGLFLRLLFLKIPLFDPDALLIRMERRLRWVWTWPAFFFSLALMAAGLVVFALNFPRISPSLSDFLTLPNLALVWLLTILVKVVHEFGHGLTCKHYGGEVHEMGALVMVFSPFLYADVSDSYVFPRKRHRLLVAGAGIYIELLIAAAATLLWALAQPGPAQQLLFNLMLITSVWTVLFNANPLMKFDGYYMLTDLLGVPNLRDKARLCVADLFRRFWFGSPAPPHVERLLPRRNRAGFVLYSIAAQLYLLHIVLGIALLFHHLLRPSGLAWLGDAVGAGALVSLLIVPVMTFLKNESSALQSRPGGWRRPALLTLGLTALTAAVLALPWQIVVERPVVLRAVDLTPVRAEVSGRILEITAATGQKVSQGQMLAKLTNPRLEAAVKAAALRVERARLEVSQAVGSGAAAAYQQAKTALAQAETALAEAKRQAALLEIRAPAEGVILTPDLARLASGSQRAGDLLCDLAPPGKVEVYFPLSQRQARHIHAGQRAEVRLRAQPGATHSGRITEDARTPPAEKLPPNLAATLGGDIAAQPDERGSLMPLEVTYGVLVQLDDPSHALRPGMTGTGRLHGDTVPLASHLWMRLLDFISLDYRW